MKVRLACVALVVGCCGTAGWLGGCSSGSSAASSDGGTDSSNTADSSLGDSSPTDSAIADSGTGASADSAADALLPAPNLRIVAGNDAALQGAPGDAVPLEVVVVLADGGTVLVPQEEITWTTPETIAAQNPNMPGADSIPEAGALPTAFFVSNDYGMTNIGVLYVVAPGAGDAGVTVTASVADAGQVSAVVAISGTPLVGDATRGQSLFQNVLGCAACHGTTAGGSPGFDAGEAGVMYLIPIGGGDPFSYPAPPLNDTSPGGSPSLAADPAWSAGLLGTAAQSDIDNGGVALRPPMPDFFGVASSDGGVALNAQDFADIYAWLKTQTH